MKTGILSKNDEGWFVKIQEDERSYKISTSQSILSRKDLDEFKNKMVVFKISKIERTVSNCKCATVEEYDKCENFIKSGINDCIDFTRIPDLGAIIDFKESRERELFELENELGITGDLRYHNKKSEEWNEFFMDLLGHGIPEKLTEKIRNKYNPPTKK